MGGIFLDCVRIAHIESLRKGGQKFQQLVNEHQLGAPIRERPGGFRDCDRRRNYLSLILLKRRGLSEPRSMGTELERIRSGHGCNKLYRDIEDTARDYQ